MAKIRKIAIFGGSFNPFTNVHLDIVDQLENEYRKVYCIVSTDSPFKKGEGKAGDLIPYYHRVNMAHLAIVDAEDSHKVGLAQTIARRYPTPLRTWQIVEFLQNIIDATPHYSGGPLELVFGEDVKDEIDRFDRIGEILSSTSIRFIKPVTKVHATDIRRMIADKDPEWESLVPEEVAKYIKLHGLYEVK